MKEKMNYKGFTIIEVVIVIAIIAMITGILTPIVFKYLDEAKETAVLEEMTNIRDAIIGEKGTGGYYSDLREFPPMYVTDGRNVYSGLMVLSRITTSFGQLYPCEKEGKIMSYAGPIVASTGNSVTGWRGPYILQSGSTADLLKDSWDYDYSYVVEPYEYDFVEVIPGFTEAVQLPPQFVFIASKGPDGQHTRVQVMDNRLDDIFNMADYPQNQDDVVMEIFASPETGGMSLLKKQDWPQ